MAVVVDIRGLGVCHEGGLVLGDAVLVGIPHSARVDRHVRNLGRPVRRLVEHEGFDCRAACVLGDSVPVRVEGFARDDRGLDPLRIVVLDRVHDEDVQGRVGHPVRCAVVVLVHGRFNLQGDRGALEDARGVTVHGLEDPDEARVVLRDAVLVHVAHDRAFDRQLGELWMAVVVLVRDHADDLEGLADLVDSIGRRIRAGVQEYPCVDAFGRPVRRFVGHLEGDLDAPGQFRVAVHVKVQDLVAREAELRRFVGAVVVHIVGARGDVDNALVLIGAVVADIVGVVQPEREFRCLGGPVACLVNHMDLRFRLADVFRMAGLVEVEGLLAPCRRQDDVGRLVLVRVLHAQGPYGLGRVLVRAVLVGVREGLEALAALEGVELPVRVVVPRLELPGDRRARLGGVVAVLVDNAGTKHPDVHPFGVAVLVLVPRLELPDPGAPAVLLGLGLEELLEGLRAAHVGRVLRQDAESEAGQSLLIEIVACLVDLSHGDRIRLEEPPVPFLFGRGRRLCRVTRLRAVGFLHVDRGRGRRRLGHLRRRGEEPSFVRLVYGGRREGRTGRAGCVPKEPDIGRIRREPAAPEHGEEGRRQAQEPQADRDNENEGPAGPFRDAVRLHLRTNHPEGRDGGYPRPQECSRWL